MSKNGFGSQIGAFILGAVFFAIGLALVVFWGLPTSEMARASQHWPTVTGVIKSSEVITSRDDEGTTMYQPEVSFAYKVDGREYVSSTIRIGATWSSSSSGGARKTVNKYQVGSSAKVAYAPEDPSIGVVEPGVSWSSHFPLWIGWGTAGIGFLIGAIPGVKVVLALFAVGSSMASDSSKSQFRDMQTHRNPNLVNAADERSGAGLPLSTTGSTNTVDDGITIQ